ncbi:MAG: hypothetical protein HPY50_07660 [Firmicutes bacterium]|nr:hypothetical protein [Bacillota bacterium]
MRYYKNKEVIEISRFRIIIVVLTLITLSTFLFGLTVLAAGSTGGAMEQSPSILVEGKALPAGSAYLENGCLMVPLRGLAESLGWNLAWNEDAREISIQDGGTEIILRLDGDTARVENDMLFRMPAPVQVVDGRSFVPLRFVCEHMKLKVGYDQEMKTAYIFREDREYHLYAEGREFTLVVSNNQSDKPMNFRFNSSQTHDFVLKQGEDTVWRMSEGKMYLTVVSDRVLGPGQCWTFQGMLDKDLAPGEYTLEAWFNGWDGRYYIKDPNPRAAINYTVPAPAGQ